MHPKAPASSPFPEHFVDFCELSEAQKKEEHLSYDLFELFLLVDQQETQ